MQRFAYLLALALLVPVRGTAQTLQIEPIPDVPAPEGAPASVAVRTSGGTPPVRFSLEGPAGAQVDEATGVVTWTPSHDLASPLQPRRTVPVVVTATDSAGSPASRMFRFVVEHANLPPQVTEVPVVEASAGTPVSQAITTVRDPDGDPLTFSAAAVDLPSGARLEPDGRFTWTPTTEEVAQLPRDVPFTVSDGRDASVGTIRIRQIGAALPPSLIVEPLTAQVWEGSEVAISIRASDRNGTQGSRVEVPPAFAGQVAYDPGTGAGTLRWIPPHTLAPEGGTVDQAIRVILWDRDNLADTAVVRVRVVDRPAPTNLAQIYRAPLREAADLQVAIERELAPLRAARVERRAWESRRTAVKIVVGLLSAAFPAFPIAEGATKTLVPALGSFVVGAVEGLEAANVFESSSELDRRIAAYELYLTSVDLEAEAFAREFAIPDARLAPRFRARSEEISRMIEQIRAEASVTSGGVTSDEQIRERIGNFVPQS